MNDDRFENIHNEINHAINFFTTMECTPSLDEYEASHCASIYMMLIRKALTEHQDKTINEVRRIVFTDILTEMKRDFNESDFDNCEFTK
jgi:alcohol dehydrogenase YqhD (iron-dependent ADH family)